MCMKCGCSTPNDKKVTVMTGSKTKTSNLPAVPKPKKK